MLKQKLLQFTCYMLVILPLFVISVEENKSSENEIYAVELTEENFDKALIKNNHFIKFYAPWCGHCKRLHPLWEELAEMMNVKDDPQVVIAKVDCTQQKGLCAKHEITGYPTLRFFKVGDKQSVKFSGTRDMPGITEFINQQLNDSGDDDNGNDNDDVKEETPPSDDGIAKAIDEWTLPVKGELLELTEANFARLVSSGNHFVKFYAPWCSHCQRLAPTWQALAKTLENEDNVSIGKIDCTIYRSICQDFDVKGYPTLLWIEDGKKIEKYSGSRDHDTLQSYVLKMLGVDSVDAKEEPIRIGKSIKDDAILNALELTAENFEQSISDGITFVKFYAPWCGHCKKLSPIWDQLAEKIHSSKRNIKIAKVDCTATTNRKLCLDEHVEGYPTLFAYRNGKRQSEYNDSRSLTEMIKYVNKLEGHDEL